MLTQSKYFWPLLPSISDEPLTRIPCPWLSCENGDAISWLCVVNQIHLFMTLLTDTDRVVNRFVRISHRVPFHLHRNRSLAQIKTLEPHMLRLAWVPLLHLPMQGHRVVTSQRDNFGMTHAGSPCGIILAARVRFLPSIVLAWNGSYFGKSMCYIRQVWLLERDTSLG